MAPPSPRPSSPVSSLSSYSRLNIKIDVAAAFARILSATKTHTQTELAAVLGVSQATISDAKCRGSIPATWLILLLLTRRISPEWILFGIGPEKIEGSTVVEDVTIASLR